MLEIKKSDKYISMESDSATQIMDVLISSYPDAKCSLNFKTPFELVVAVILSAQCTDERVNKVTPMLFEKYNTPELISKMSVECLEETIRSCGFYRVKAKNIIKMSQELIERFDSKVPENMEELMSLSGVGRKIANVIMLEAFNKTEGIAVDTHVKRVSNRIGFSNEKEPEKIEKDLMRLIPRELFKDVNHALIWHGRKCCKAPRPKCNECPVEEKCQYKEKKL